MSKYKNDMCSMVSRLFFVTTGISLPNSHSVRLDANECVVCVCVRVFVCRLIYSIHQFSGVSFHLFFCQFLLLFFIFDLYFYRIFVFIRTAYTHHIFFFGWCCCCCWEFTILRFLLHVHIFFRLRLRK